MRIEHVDKKKENLYMDNNANEHHLILGEITDILTGQILADTYDERYRQKICHLLLNEKGFDKTHIRSRVIHELKAGNSTAKIKVDFLVQYQAKIICLIKYAPGSIVTRRLSTLALSRTITPYQIPFVVVTNGEDAEVIDGDTGNVLETGMGGIPNIGQVKSRFSTYSFKPITAPVLEQANRIAFACEVDGACPCDTDICITTHGSL